MTAAQTISIHRALTELKTIDSRINTAIASAALVVPNRRVNKKIEGLSIADYEKKLQSDYDKAVGLINRRDEIKAAIVQSNATTIVEVAGEKMTVAQAIDRKTSIENKTKLLSRLMDARRKAIIKVSQENDALTSKLEAYLISILGPKDSAKKEDVELHTNSFIERNEFELIDPLNSSERIEALEREITGFMTEVDAVLSESNATTVIQLNAVEL